jgi:N-acetylglucosamine kinase-like BadF-type ATPase
MRFVIGLDQGGSGTRAVVCSPAGRILGSGNGPGACHVYTGMEAAMQATHSAASSALAQAGISTGKAELFVGGYTGADWPDEYGLLRNAVEGLNLAERYIIVNDSIVAMRGGTGHPYGAILVAGTGANCAVLAPDGREFIYHYYHDAHLQGGSSIGEAALTAIFRARTGRPPQTSLSARVLGHFDLPDVDSLMRNLVEGGIPGNRVSEIAPLVFDEAEKGDLAAQKILTNFGEGCAELLVNGLRQLDMVDLAVEIVLSGGVFKAKSPLLRETLRAAVTRDVPGATLVEAHYEPVVGAALLALEKAGIQIDASLRSNLERTAQEFGLVRAQSPLTQNTPQA